MVLIGYAYGMRCGFVQSTAHFRPDQSGKKQADTRKPAETLPPIRPTRRTELFFFAGGQDAANLTIDRTAHGALEDLNRIPYRFLQNPKTAKARAFHCAAFAQAFTENCNSAANRAFHAISSAARPAGTNHRSSWADLRDDADTGTDQPRSSQTHEKERGAKHEHGERTQKQCAAACILPISAA